MPHTDASGSSSAPARNCMNLLSRMSSSSFGDTRGTRGISSKAHQSVVKAGNMGMRINNKAPDDDSM